MSDEITKLTENPCPTCGGVKTVTFVAPAMPESELISHMRRLINDLQEHNHRLQMQAQALNRGGGYYGDAAPQWKVFDKSQI